MNMDKGTESLSQKSGKATLIGLTLLIAGFLIGEIKTKAQVQPQQTEQKTETIRLLDQIDLPADKYQYKLNVMCDAPRKTIMYIGNTGNGTGISTMFRPDICK